MSQSQPKQQPIPLRPLNPAAFEPAPDDRIQRAFEEFHRRFPDVYNWLVAAARAKLKKGATRLSIAMLYEHLRAYCAREGFKGEGYEFPNEYRSRYVRLMMRQEPDLVGKFKVRQLKA
jgi:hypothetical protein